MGDRVASQRGVALLIAKQFNCFPVGKASPYYSLACISGPGLKQPFIAGTVYIPHRMDRQQAINTLARTLGELQEIIIKKLIPNLTSDSLLDVRLQEIYERTSKATQQVICRTALPSLACQDSGSPSQHDGQTGLILAMGVEHRRVENPVECRRNLASFRAKWAVINSPA